MSSHRIPSFTEYALLNRWALDLFSPSDFNKRRIDSVGNSVLQSFEQTKVNPYSTTKNSSYLYIANKFFITTPLKVAYIACITLTISRLGVLMNGGLTVFSYFRYKISNHPNESWEKTKNYAFACFADLSSALAGMFLTKVVVENIFYTLHFARIGSWMGSQCKLPILFVPFLIALNMACIFLGSAGLITLQSSSVAPQFFAKPRDRVGMYLAMNFRKRLGLVSQNGGLLPFSQQDQIQISGRRLDDNGQKLNKMIFLAEMELLELVKDLKDSGQEIRYSYPFNGETVARALESKNVNRRNGRAAQNALGSFSNLTKQVHELRSLQIKIEVLRETFLKALKLSFENSIPIWIIKQIFRVKTQEFDIPLLASYISEKDYRSFYNFRPQASESRQAFVQQENNFNINWKAIDLEPIDPSKPMRLAQGLYPEFKYDVCVNKWASQNAQPDHLKTPQQLLSLPEGCTFADYKKKRREYYLAIHPDKNNNSKESEELFKCLDSIIRFLDEVYKR